MNTLRILNDSLFHISSYNWGLNIDAAKTVEGSWSTLSRCRLNDFQVPPYKYIFTDPTDLRVWRKWTIMVPISFCRLNILQAPPIGIHPYVDWMSRKVPLPAKFREENCRLLVWFAFQFLEPDNIVYWIINVNFHAFNKPTRFRAFLYAAGSPNGFFCQGLLPLFK